MSEWINCDDGMPDLAREVFFIRRDCGDDPLAYGIRKPNYWYDRKYGERVPCVDVVSWQYMNIPELPEPPKSDGPFIWEDNCIVCLDTQGAWLGHYDFGESHRFPQDLIDWLNSLPKASLERHRCAS